MNGAKFVDQLKFQVTLLNAHCDGDFKAIYGLILQADLSNTLAFAIPNIRWWSVVCGLCAVCIVVAYAHCLRRC